MSASFGLRFGFFALLTAWTGLLAGIVLGIGATIYDIAVGVNSHEPLPSFLTIAGLCWFVPMVLSIPLGVTYAAVVGWMQIMGKPTSSTCNYLWVMQTIVCFILVLLAIRSYGFVWLPNVLVVLVNFFMGLWVTYRWLPRHIDYWAWNLPEEEN